MFNAWIALFLPRNSCLFCLKILPTPRTRSINHVANIKPSFVFTNRENPHYLATKTCKQTQKITKVKNNIYKECLISFVMRKEVFSKIINFLLWFTNCFMWIEQKVLLLKLHNLTYVKKFFVALSSYSKCKKLGSFNF